MRCSVTDKEISNVINDMTIICDNREKKNDHIIEFLKLNEIKYKIEKLETADYSFVLDKYDYLKFNKQILIEKKNSLSEIAGNFTSSRERFEREFERITTEKLHLVIEETTWKKVYNGSYRSKMSPNSMMASILTYHIRYNVPIWFVGKNESPALIYNLMKYELREKLKNL